MAEDRDSPAGAVVVRPAEQDDANALARLAGELGYPSTPVKVLARLDRLRADPGSHAVFVAERAPGAVLGWLHVFVARRLETDCFAEIGGLVVSSGARSAGVGAALVARAERWALDHGLTTLRVRSNVTRQRTHRFYERYGFARVKEQLVLQKPLAPQQPATPPPA
jgi:GNAT superfamily N-acetyltransferase